MHFTKEQLLIPLFQNLVVLLALVQEVYTYLGYQNVEVYKDAVVLSDLSETSGLSWSNYLDIDAVYTDLEKSGYGEYQPKN